MFQLKHHGIGRPHWNTDYPLLSLGEVIVLHKDGSMDFTIDIRSEKPNDVTCIDSNTIAVSVKYSDNQVRVIDLKKRSITNKVNTKSTVYGIAYTAESNVDIVVIVSCYAPW
jgi:hypothetical protein